MMEDEKGVSHLPNDIVHNTLKPPSDNIMSEYKSGGKLANMIGQYGEDETEKYLKEHGIPYYKNVKYKLKKEDVFELDFITPAGLIEVKNTDKYEKMKIRKQIKRFLKYLPLDIMIYIYNPRKCKDINLKLGNNCDRVKYVHDLNDICFPKIPYYVTNPQVLRSICSLNNPNYDQYIDCDIFTSKFAYKVAPIILNGIELIRFNSLNIQFENKARKYIELDLTKKYKLIKNSTLERIHKMFYAFRIVIDSYSNNISDPTEVIKGITQQCTYCNKIIWTKWVQKHKNCNKCGFLNEPIIKHNFDKDLRDSRAHKRQKIDK
jgi:hypothetical protein